MLPFLLAALAVSAIGAGVSRRWRVPGQALMAVGGLALVAVLALQVRQNLFPPQPKSSSRSDMAVSACLANFILRDLSGRSGTVILLFPEQRLMDADTERSYEEGFTLPMRHAGGKLHLKALHLEAPKGKAGPALPAFTQAIGQAPDALAFVSYAGAPAGFESLFSGQPKSVPFYVFDPDGTTNWLASLKEGHVRAAVLPRVGVSPHARESATGGTQDIFDRFYLLVTAQNVDQVAGQVGKR
jgi:hypothetical protein